VDDAIRLLMQEIEPERRSSPQQQQTQVSPRPLVASLGV
jgi:hypothetical protein